MLLRTTPKIEIVIIGAMSALSRHEFERRFQVGTVGQASGWFVGTGWMSVFLDVDAAERAVAWLKEHGAEQER